jgi:hypothetical protein
MRKGKDVAPSGPTTTYRVVCGNCHKEGHPIERCFELHPELRRGGAPRVGGDRGRDGRGLGRERNPPVGRGGGIPPRDATAATRIEELEKQLAAALALRAPVQGGEASSSQIVPGFSDLDYMCGVAQVHSTTAVTRAATRVIEPRGAAEELDPQ